LEKRRETDDWSCRNRGTDELEDFIHLAKEGEDG